MSLIVLKSITTHPKNCIGTAIFLTQILVLAHCLEANMYIRLQALILAGTLLTILSNLPVGMFIQV